MMRYPWLSFNKKLRRALEQPQCSGSFSSIEARSGMRLAVGEEGSRERGVYVRIELLVDLEDGIIADAKFQAFGPPSLIVAAEGICILALRKNYDQARRISAELIDLEFREKKQESAFPGSASQDLNAVLSALEHAAKKCLDIPIADGYIAPPPQMQRHSQGERAEALYPQWLEIEKPQQLAIIEKVIAEEIRPYIELDAGGINIQDVKGYEILIAYQGSCTSCYSATGSTLSAIQQILRTKIHEEIVVIPDLASLKLED